MYRADVASSRPDGFANFALDRLGVFLESRWRVFSLRRRVARVLLEAETMSSLQEYYPDRIQQESRRANDYHLALAIARWEFIFGCKPSVQTVSAAMAAASGAIGELVERDDGDATALAALIVALAGAPVSIVVAGASQEKLLAALIERVWAEPISVPVPDVVNLKELAEQHTPLIFAERATLVLLHDAGDVLAETGERLVIATGSQELGITEFTRRALVWGESTLSGADFNFDTELAKLTLTDTFLSRLKSEAGNSFGSWKNVILREEAARDGILAVHCLVLDTDFKLDGERVVPLTQAAGNIIATAGARLEAVLAAHHGLDPKPLADQRIRKFREILASNEIAGGISFNDDSLAPFFLRSTGLLTLTVAAKPTIVIPGSTASGRIYESEISVDFREQDPALSNVAALLQELPQNSLLQVVGAPSSFGFLRAMDCQAQKGVKVAWQLDDADMTSGTFFRFIFTVLPEKISARALRLLCQWRLSGRERERCKKLEDGLQAQQKITTLLAINSSEYAV